MCAACKASIAVEAPFATGPQVRPLVGRESAEKAVEALLSEEGARLVTLTGPGGVGKTSLGLAVADKAGARYSGVGFSC